MERYIVEVKNNLTPEICKRIIEYFENSNEKEIGFVGDGQYIPDLKKTKDLRITDNEIDSILYEKLSEGLKIYHEHFLKLIDKIENKTYVTDFLADIRDTWYIIGKYEKGDHFYWHQDMDKSQSRILACIWYLNSLDTKIHGGSTEFLCGKNIEPEEGKLLIFPSTWPFIHKGSELLTNKAKYIITTFITMPK